MNLGQANIDHEVKAGASRLHMQHTALDHTAPEYCVWRLRPLHRVVGCLLYAEKDQYLLRIWQGYGDTSLHLATAREMGLQWEPAFGRLTLEEEDAVVYGTK